MSAERWTEDRILANFEESFYFERKAGALIGKSEFKLKLAKAISAFANSEGGVIAIGVNDDGSFDGVDHTHKGSSKTSEWLGDVIKNLVVPRVQRVHIQEVIPSVHTQIPAGKVLIVIDVEKSELAPHQSTEDNIYYYRVDKQSNAAPHNYVENLFFRDKFPGPKIAEAWVYTVLNPLINTIEWEGKYLENEQWGFDRFNTDRPRFLKPLADSMSGNLRQFLQHNPEFRFLINEHDQKMSSLIELLKICYESISQSSELKEACANVTSLEFLRKLQDPNKSSSYFNFKDYTTRDQFIESLFSPRKADDIQRTIAEYVLNNAPKLAENSIAPFWNLFHDGFVLLRSEAFAEEARRLTESTLELGIISANLLESLIKERDSLCQRHMIPPDEPPPTVIQTTGRFI